MRDAGPGVILAAGCDEMAELLERRGLPVAARVASVEYLLPLAAVARPGVVLMAARPGEAVSLVSAVSRLRLAVPGCPLVVLSGSEDAAALEEAGAAAVFRPPYDAEAVAKTVEGLLRQGDPCRREESGGEREAGAWPGCRVDDDGSAGEAWLRARAWGGQPDLPPVWAPPGSGPARVVVALVSNKGGVGRSLLAAALAACLARRLPGQVLLLDLDLSCGDLETYVHAAPGADLTELAAAGDGMDLALLARCLRRLPFGCDFLPGPRRPETAAGVTVAHLEDLLRWARNRYGAVVADTGGDVADPRLAPVLEAATHLVVPALPDPASLRQARLTMAVLASRGAVQEARLLPVLNRVGRGPVGAAGIMEALGVQPVLSIPEDRFFTARVGTPVRVAGWSRLLSPGGRAVDRLADIVCEGVAGGSAGRDGRRWPGLRRGGAPERRETGWVGL